MSGWSTTYRWSGVTRANFMGLLRHDARDVDRQNGREVSHSNAFIDAAYTGHNKTLVNDGASNFVPMSKVEEAVAFLDKRIAGAAPNTRRVTDRQTGEDREAPVALRKDASVCVEFVLKLDPKYTRDPRIDDEAYDAMTPEQRAALPPDIAHMTPVQIADVRAKLRAMIFEVMERMGRDNVIFVAEHWDESLPHVQMGVVPMTADRKISQKQVLGGKDKSEAQEKYQAAHESMRVSLRAVGYDPTDERVARGRPNQSLEDFKESRDRNRRERAALREAEQELSKVSEIRELARLEGFNAGFDEGRSTAEVSVRADLIALDLIAPDDDAPILPRRKAPTLPKRGLTPARERQLSLTRTPTK